MFLFSSCKDLFDEIFEEGTHYGYRMQNSTTSTVRVTVQVKQNSGLLKKEDEKFYCGIRPGSAEAIHNTSCFAEETIFDEEKTNAGLYWFIVAPSKYYSAYSINFNIFQGWLYQEENKFNATYTLTITEDNDQADTRR